MGNLRHLVVRWERHITMYSVFFQVGCKRYLLLTPEMRAHEAADVDSLPVLAYNLSCRLVSKTWP